MEHPARMSTETGTINDDEKRKSIFYEIKILRKSDVLRKIGRNPNFKRM